MPKSVVARASVASALCLLAVPVGAQTSPDIFVYDRAGDYDTLLSLNQPSGPPIEREIIGNIPQLTLALENASPQRFAGDFGINPLTADFDFISGASVNGVVVVALGGNSPDPTDPTGDFEVFVPCLSTGEYVIQPGGVSGPDDSGFYGLDFEASSYQQGYADYRSWLDGGNVDPDFQGDREFTAAQFRTDVYGCGVTDAGVNPIVGNPDSVQFQQVSDGLDLSAPQLGDDDAAWGIGLRAGRTQYGGRYGTQVAARVNRSFRPFEGSRTLLTFDVPVTYQRVAGQEQWRGYAAAALTVPLRPWWTVTPRLSYGFASAPDEEVKGQVAAATLASNLFFPDLVGRGAVTLGGMVGYSKVTRVEFAGKAIDGGKTENVSFRAGGAYELPLATRLFARTASVRGSYAFTLLTGDALYVNKVHELSASVGVRSRGGEQRNSFELFRLGLMARLAERSNAASMFLGYRF